jgi:hypothetical protein
MTLVARIVAADSRCSLRRALILDRMIAVSPSWTDQFSNLASPAGPDSGGPTFVFALKGRRWSIRGLTLHLPQLSLECAGRRSLTPLPDAVRRP